MLDVNECFEVPRGEQSDECVLLIGESIGHEALIVLNESCYILNGALLVDGE